MKKIFACAFLLGLCSVPVFNAVAETDEPGANYTTMEYYETTGTECKRVKRSDSSVGYCDDKEVGAYCTEDIKNIPIHRNAASEAKCVEVYTTARGWHRSCAATKCNDKHMLWIGYDKNAHKWASMGVCHERDNCDCGICGDGGKCVALLDMTKKGYSWDDGDIQDEFWEGRKMDENGDWINKDPTKWVKNAYNKCVCEKKVSTVIERRKTNQIIPQKGPCADKKGDELICCEAEQRGEKVKWEDGRCVCREGGTFDPITGKCEEQCTITADVEIRYVCPSVSGEDSNVVIVLEGGDTIPAPAGSEDCNKVNEILEGFANLGSDTARGIKMLDKLCEFLTGGSGSSATLTSMDKWIEGLEDSKSQWKDASGNFNTARLASDLTAGVVLGTVGGVVSGVVIKKKQVEKGFESLGCYIGGKKMSDWGDIFKVTFTKN